MGWKIIVLSLSILLCQTLLFTKENIGKSKGKTNDPVSLRRIESDVTDAFENIISLWKNRKYDDLYDCGDTASCTAVSKEDFKKRMADKTWEPATSWETVRDIQVTVKSPALAQVRAKIGYKPKIGGDTRFQTKTYTMRMEDGVWRISLSKLLSFPK